METKILGRPMRKYVLEIAEAYGITESAEPAGELLVLRADMPLVTKEQIEWLREKHRERKGIETVATVAGDAYLFDAESFVKIVERLGLENKDISDAVLDAVLGKTDVVAWKDDIYLSRIDTKAKYAQAVSILRERINYAYMADGITMIDPSNTYISPETEIGEGTVIHPNCYIEGHTVIGCNCVVGPNTSLTNTKVADDVEITFSVLTDSEVGRGTVVGPFAYMRPHSKVGEYCKVGDFVEIKNATIGDHTKASHLTYIGDADVGSHINFGCGTVVVNYDGKHKYRTVIEDGVFIGCNTNLVAPVTVKAGAFTAAGSTITDDVPENALAIARARQVNKEGWKRPE